MRTRTMTKTKMKMMTKKRTSNPHEGEAKASSILFADGLLGYEDEADDARNGVTREQGDRNRTKTGKDIRDGEQDYDPYSHEDGKWLQ
jgi:hypothetical protein